MTTYTDEDWPHGLRCTECDTLFVEGMPISERFLGISEMQFDGEPVFILDIVCAGCATVTAKD